MDSELKDVLAGRYPWPDLSKPNANLVINTHYKVWNKSGIPLDVKSYYVGERHRLAGSLNVLLFDGVSKDSQHNLLTRVVVGDYLIFTVSPTGAFYAAHKVLNTTGARPGDGVDCLIEQPTCTINDISTPPEPTADTLVPPDSQKFLIGTGTFVNPKNGGRFVVLHEQFWKRSPSSFSIGPKATKTVVVTTTHGRTETTTDSTIISASLGVDVSGGWGPFAASISASLDYTRSVSQTLTLTDTVEVSVDDQYSNDSLDEERTHLYWTLIDQFTFLASEVATNDWLSGKFVMPVTVECAQVPSILRVHKRKLFT